MKPLSPVGARIPSRLTAKIKIAISLKIALDHKERINIITRDYIRCPHGSFTMRSQPTLPSESLSPCRLVSAVSKSIKTGGCALETLDTLPISGTPSHFLSPLLQRLGASGAKWNFGRPSLFDGRKAGALFSPRRAFGSRLLGRRHFYRLPRYATLFSRFAPRLRGCLRGGLSVVAATIIRVLCNKTAVAK